MKEFDSCGLDIAVHQAEVFFTSVTRLTCSSPIFLRRFFKSHYAEILDLGKVYLLPLEVDDAFAQIEKEFGKTAYGTTKYPAEAMYWLGYMTRYIAYTREVSSRFVYKHFPPKILIDHYSGWHTQGEEWVIEALLTLVELKEEDFDPNVRLKKLLRKDK